MRYQVPAAPRFKVDDTGSGPVIRIKGRAPAFTMLFIPVWLLAWTARGIGAAVQLANHFDPFLCGWLCFWAVGWVWAAAVVGWFLFGFETISVVDGDLVSAIQLGRFAYRRAYQGTEIRSLRAASRARLWR